MIETPGSPIPCRSCKKDGHGMGNIGIEMRRIFQPVRRTRQVDIQPGYDQRVVITCTANPNHERIMPRGSSPIDAMQWIVDSGSLESINDEWRGEYAWEHDPDV